MPVPTNLEGTQRCTRRRQRDGEACRAFAMRGTDPPACRKHAGRATSGFKAQRAVFDELRTWGLDGHVELADPGMTLLRLVTQSAARVERYSRLLGEAFAAAEELRQAHAAGRLLVVERGQVPGEVPDYDEEGIELPESPEVQAARLKVDQVFATGGVAALVGYRFDADRHGRVYAVDEGIRGLAKLEAEERDRCANFAAKAVAAGLAERMVRLAERQGALMAELFARAIAAAGLAGPVGLALKAALADEIEALTGPQVIEGRVAS